VSEIGVRDVMGEFAEGDAAFVFLVSVRRILPGRPSSLDRQWVAFTVDGRTVATEDRHTQGEAFRLAREAFGAGVVGLKLGAVFEPWQLAAVRKAITGDRHDAVRDGDTAGGADPGRRGAGLRDPRPADDRQG
jgi:hypothetical protein